MQRFNKDIIITVGTVTLLDTLKANRDKHILDYAKALEGWKLDTLARLQQLTSMIENGHTNLNLTIDGPPKSMQKDYELAIDMVSWNQDHVMQLDQQQFNAFVRDDWDWKSIWTSTNSKYLQ